jgi:hypothetical protein
MTFTILVVARGRIDLYNDIEVRGRVEPATGLPVTIRMGV